MFSRSLLDTPRRLDSSRDLAVVWQAAHLHHAKDPYFDRCVHSVAGRGRTSDRAAASAVYVDGVDDLSDQDSDTESLAPRDGHLRVDLQLTFEEAAEGCTRGISVTRREPCAECDASGFTPGTAVDCAECQGTGAVLHFRRSGGPVTANCSRCVFGKVAKKCTACGGAGAWEDTSELEVSVPAGVDDGQVLRLAGKGEAVRGGAPGHLYVVLGVLPHRRFIRRGSDLVVDVLVSREVATRGGRVTVPMLVGERDVEVPAGSRTGDEIEVRGCGVQIVGAPPTPMAAETDAPYREIDTSGRGNLVVRISIEERGLRARMRGLRARMRGFRVRMRRRLRRDR